MPDTHNLTPTQRVAPAQIHSHVEAVPGAPLLQCAALLSGFGTAFLGPSLPVLTTALHQSDRGGGALLAAQFTGAFLGGWTTREPLHRSLLVGYTLAMLGFALLAIDLRFYAAVLPALAALLLLGFGVGRIITSNNLLAALRWPHRRGAALTLLNFTWSAGALCAPLLLPSSLALPGPAVVFGSFAMVLAASLLATAFTPTGAPEQAAAPPPVAAPTGLGRQAFLYFCLQLFLYGGVETSLSGWLSTYDLRYTSATQVFAASTAAFWFCLTGSRAAASALLLRLPERPILRAGLAITICMLTALLAFGHGHEIPVLAGLTGAALAPWFPLLFSGLVGEGPTATQAGRIVAVSGLGAAALPWLVGQISAKTGSLREALLLPIAGTVALLLLSLRRSAVRPAA